MSAMVGIGGDFGLNRKERRKHGIKEKPKTITITADYLEKLKKEISVDATETAFEYMMCIPLIILHDHYGRLNKKEVDGMCREERFFELCLDQFESFSKKYVSLQDMAQAVKEETGFDVISRFKNKKGFKI